MPSTVDELKRVPLFAGLSVRQLRKLASRVRERRFKNGNIVLREGSMGGIGFFVLTDGEASVTVGGREVARLSPGDHFGELALVSKSARTATVTALTEIRCLEIAFSDFRDFAHANPDVTWKLLQDLVAMLDRDKSS
jgi:CRP-like cAMP-binding protein